MAIIQNKLVERIQFQKFGTRRKKRRFERLGGFFFPLDRNFFIWLEFLQIGRKIRNGGKEMVGPLFFFQDGIEKEAKIKKKRTSANFSDRPKAAKDQKEKKSFFSP
jgi:hypothetical protein